MALKDGSPGSLSYHLKARQWTLDTDESRVIAATSLRKTNLCDHHLSLYQDLAREGLSQNPPLDDEALRLLREQCVKWAEGTTLNKSLMLAQAIALSPTFGLELPHWRWLLSPGEIVSRQT